eukprot:3252710-Pleurochrysis_carterae.AAC.2
MHIVRESQSDSAIFRSDTRFAAGSMRHMPATVLTKTADEVPKNVKQPSESGQHQAMDANVWLNAMKLHSWRVEDGLRGAPLPRCSIDRSANNQVDIAAMLADVYVYMCELPQIHATGPRAWTIRQASNKPRRCANAVDVFSLSSALAPCPFAFSVLVQKTKCPPSTRRPPAHLSAADNVTRHERHQPPRPHPPGPFLGPLGLEGATPLPCAAAPVPRPTVTDALPVGLGLGLVTPAATALALLWLPLSAAWRPSLPPLRASGGGEAASVWAATCGGDRSGGGGECVRREGGSAGGHGRLGGRAGPGGGGGDESMGTMSSERRLCSAMAKEEA